MKRYLQHILPLALLLLPVTSSAQEDSTVEGRSDSANAAASADDRITFNFKLSEAGGGGQATGSAGDIEYQEDLYLIATGGVDFKYQGLRLQAERIRVDIPTNLLTAEGEVILDEGAQRMIGETIEYDLTTRTGRVSEATAYLEGDYYITGSQIAKTGPVTFTVNDGILTSCSQDVPSWSIHLSEAKVTAEEYARIKNARLKFKKLPVFYAPYIIWPANTDRASGLLVPKPGYSNRRGAELSLAYFQTMGRSADATFQLDVSSDSYIGLGSEVRYRPSERTQGYFKSYLLNEPEDMDFFPGIVGDRDRWKVELQHETRDFWGGFRGVIDFQEYSDLDYLQDYERNPNQQSQSFIYSNAFLTKNTGPHSLNILIDQRERIVSGGRKDVRRQLPEVEYRLRKLRLGRSQIYLDLESSMNYFDLDLAFPVTTFDPVTNTNVTESIPFTNQYGRLDFSPTVSIPLSSLPWLSAEVELGGRATYYTDSLTDPLLGSQDFTNDALDRVFPRVGLEIIGPSISRIFDRKIGRFSKLKHIVEPRITYAFVGDFDDQNLIFSFDEIDNLSPANGMLFSVTNRLMAKPTNEDEGGAVEIASMAISQGLSLDKDRPGQQSSVDPTRQTDEGPLGLALRVNPSAATSVRLDTSFNTLFDSYDIQSMRLSGTTKWGHHLFGLSWFSNWNVDLERTVLVPSEDDPEVLVPSVPFDERAVISDKSSEQVRLSTKLALLPNRLSLEAEFSFDVLGPLKDSTAPELGRDSWDLRQQRFFLNWASQCYSWQLEYRESNLREIPDRDVRFSLTLKNVGTFLDLNDSF